jgi:hypothetical protein
MVGGASRKGKNGKGEKKKPKKKNKKKEERNKNKRLLPGLGASAPPAAGRGDTWGRGESLPELRLPSGRGLTVGRGLTTSLAPAAPLAPKVPFFSSSFFLSFFLTIQKSALDKKNKREKEKKEKREKKGGKRTKSQGERLTHYIFAEGALQSQWTTETHQDKYFVWDCGDESEELGKKPTI